jgi:hypothetical protein
MIAIDQFYLNSLVVLDLYLTANAKGYSVYSFSYGSLASMVKIIPAPIPAYLSFNYPAYTAL